MSNYHEINNKANEAFYKAQKDTNNLSIKRDEVASQTSSAVSHIIQRSAGASSNNNGNKYSDLLNAFHKHSNMMANESSKIMQNQNDTVVALQQDFAEQHKYLATLIAKLSSELIEIKTLFLDSTSSATSDLSASSTRSKVTNKVKNFLTGNGKKDKKNTNETVISENEEKVSDSSVETPKIIN